MEVIHTEAWGQCRQIVRAHGPEILIKPSASADKVGPAVTSAAAKASRGLGICERWRRSFRLTIPASIFCAVGPILVRRSIAYRRIKRSCVTILTLCMPIRWWRRSCPRYHQGIARSRCFGPSTMKQLARPRPTAARRITRAVRPLSSSENTYEACWRQCRRCTEGQTREVGAEALVFPL
jgi:hypothetical protein